METRQQHWDRVYGTKEPEDLTWFQETPQVSLSLIEEMELPAEARIIDVGGGTSTLSSFLLEKGFKRISVLDVSGAALSLARARLGPRSQEVEWIEADLLQFEPTTSWTLWHDRAVFHFLTSETDREAYRRVLEKGLKPGGYLIMATFALEGPSRCSGLDCVRYSPESLGSALGSGFLLRGSVEEAHRTPAGGVQAFNFSWFQRTN